MAHASSNGLLTIMSPAIRRELEDVRSILTATTSHDSSFSVVLDSTPRNHHTLRVEDEDDSDVDDAGDDAVEEVEECVDVTKLL